MASNQIHHSVSVLDGGAVFVETASGGVVVGRGTCELVVRSDGDNGAELVVLDGLNEHLLFSGGYGEAALFLQSVKQALGVRPEGTSHSEGRLRVHPALPSALAGMIFAGIVCAAAVVWFDAAREPIVEAPASAVGFERPATQIALPDAPDGLIRPLPRPGFITVPEDLPPLELADDPYEGQDTEGEAAEAPSLLPAYDPDLYSSRPASEESAQVPASGVSGLESEAEISATQPPGAGAAQDGPAVTPHALPSPAEVEDHPSEAAPQASAAEVIQQVVSSGLDADEAREILVRLQSLAGADPETITPEMLEGLPHEVAHLILQSGVPIDEEEGDFSITILPDAVIDAHRGPDGIASIPENHSWYARGRGPITLPFPGGGDIDDVSKFAEFGIEP